MSCRRHDEYEVEGDDDNPIEASDVELVLESHQITVRAGKSAENTTMAEPGPTVH